MCNLKGVGYKAVIYLTAFLLLSAATQAGAAPPSTAQERMVEWTIESHKTYPDPFNDVDVDVIFSDGKQSWRVPTFWRGGNRWTVRFAPPASGDYAYHLESTDRHNPDLNGHSGHVTITPYAGNNALLEHGMLRLSANKRYFEFADGTPFYWLGDTWWTGLSDRISWEGFQTLAADRKNKGFTVVQINTLAPSQEELAPVDAGFRNEGGAVWDPEFKSINPQYFDYADRRIQHIVDQEIAPAIVGGASQIMSQMGVAKLKQHWRYTIARYGAYPVFWIVDDDAFDPPPEAEVLANYPLAAALKQAGWTEVARYIRSIDPYHHPLTANPLPPPFDVPFQDASVADFDMIQPGHQGWASIAAEVAQITSRYARGAKPIVVGEIGYESFQTEHYQNFQCAAFWLAMLNGAAGHTYGTIETAEMYSADKPLHRLTWSLYSWEEAMDFPGSAQVGLDAKFLRQFPWQRLVPHPEWIVPRATTLFDLQGKAPKIDLAASAIDILAQGEYPSEDRLPTGDWQRLHGTFRRPYAAGIPGKLRLIYMPFSGAPIPAAPTVLGLEPGVKYTVYYWEPALGVRIDLGEVARPEPGNVLFTESFDPAASARWIDLPAGAARNGKLTSAGALLTTVRDLQETDLVAAVDVKSDAQAAIVLRFRDADNFLRAVYSPRERAIFLVPRIGGADQSAAGRTPTPDLGPNIRLTAEVRGQQSIISVTDGERTYTSPIIPGDNVFTAWLPGPAVTGAGRVGLLHESDGGAQTFSHFEIRASAKPFSEPSTQIDLVDANGVFRGKLKGPGWEDYGKRDKVVLLDAYLPERPPYACDWLLVLDGK
jgi:hypothetical protein